MIFQIIKHSSSWKTGKGGGIAVFLHEFLTFNISNDLIVNNADIDALCVEIINKKSKNILINTQIELNHI